MALNASDLADAINAAIGAVDKDNNPVSTTSQMLTYANAIISTLQASLFSHVPGTVTGTAPPAPGAVGDLAATGGIAVVLPTLWNSIMSAGFVGADPSALTTDSNGGATYLSGASSIEFAAGDLEGESTAVAVPPTPGVLVFTATGTPGTINGLVGSDWATAVMPLGGNFSLTTNIYNAIVNYIMSNAECEYAPGTVNGNFPAVNSPLVGGNGVGGTIS